MLHWIVYGRRILGFHLVLAWTTNIFANKYFHNIMLTQFIKLQDVYDNDKNYVRMILFQNEM